MGVIHTPSLARRAALAAAVALALLGAGGCGGPPSSLMAAPGAPPLAVSPHSPLSAAQLGAARRATRAAAAAYLGAAAGRMPAPSAPLGSGLAARLADLAASREARPAGPSARLVGLALAPRGPRAIAATLALARRGQAPYGIKVGLRLVGGRWLAVAMPAS